jgi:hypothetical protein
VSGSLGACSTVGGGGCGATTSSGAAGAVSTTDCVLTGAALGVDSCVTSISLQKYQKHKLVFCPELELENRQYLQLMIEKYSVKTSGGFSGGDGG